MPFTGQFLLTSTISFSSASVLATEDFSQARQIYKEALKQAEKKGDSASAQHIRKELAVLAKKKKQASLTREEQKRESD